MSVKKRILLYYVTILVTAMIIGGLYPYATSSTIIMNILFLPVAILLWSALIKSGRQAIETKEQIKNFFLSKKMKVLLVYSSLVSVVLAIGSILSISSCGEAGLNNFTLPFCIQLLMWLFALFSKTSKR